MNNLMRTHPEVQYSSVKGFINNGLLGKILISQNVCHIRHMTVNSGGGYVHILTDVIPRFKAYGVSDAEIQTMMVENPKRLLAFPS
jgi:phosphotriesterase-related protein